MKRRHPVILTLASAGLVACATTSDQGTLAELEQLQADIDDVHLDDSLERAAHSYRRYLEETSESALTAEAMRRLADLQIEQEYGVIGGGPLVEIPAPDAATQSKQIVAVKPTTSAIAPSESEQEFERRASQRQELLSGAQ